MKKLIATIVLVLTSFVVFPLSAQAAPPSSNAVSRVPAWSLNGDYTIAFDCATCVPHYVQIASHDVYTGAFSGTGYYVPIPSFTWNVSGLQAGNQVSMRILYTGTGAGYYVDLVGTIAADGSMSGTATDSSGGHFGWTTTAGRAIFYANHGAFVSAQGGGPVAAQSPFGKPIKP